MAIGAVLAGLLGGWWWLGTTQAERPWNVVLITLDTTRADRLGCYGARLETPAIDALARTGVRFEHCYCTVPLTLPSHASLMTGLVSLRHGVHDNGPERLAAEADTLAEMLSRRGYATGAVVGAFVLDRRFGLNQGFDDYDDEMPAAPRGPLRHAERSAEEVTDAAIAWLAIKRDAPVFLWTHYFDAHAPYSPPGYNPRLATLEPYDAEIAYVDAQLKRLLAGVARRLGERTLIVLTADHGEGLGQHGETTHGLFTYEQTLRVPLVIVFPDRRHAGRVIRAPACLVDVVPSLLAWLDLPAPGPLDGEPLALEEAEERDADRPRALYFGDRFPLNMFGWSPLEGIVVGRHKLIRAPRSELYDLRHDPLEQINLFESQGAVARRLSDRLDETVAQFAARGALKPAAAEVNEADLKRLRALGYVGASRRAGPVDSPSAQSLADPKDMLNVYQQIEQLTILFDQGQAADAIRMLLKILESGDPANKRALRLAAALALGEPATRPRILACLRARALDDRAPCVDPFVLGKLGVALVDDGRAAEAVKIFSRLVQLEPTSAAAYQHLAAVQEQLGNAAEAERLRAQARSLAQVSDEPPDWEGNAADEHGGHELAPKQ